MSEISITKKDVAWSYISKVLQIGSGLITLPLILHLLSPEEIGMNYVMLTISSVVAMLDFGFSPQFGKNFSYVNSGAQILLKEGIDKNHISSDINYHLLSVLIRTAQYVYKRLSLLSLFVMLIGGSLYIYHVTNGFCSVNNALPIWILYSVSIYFNIYFSYYTGLLTGCGMINEVSKSIILSRISYLLICVSFLLIGGGLASIVIANFISPFVQRYYCYKKYFTKEMKNKLDEEIQQDEIKKTFNTIWYNAKKMGINFLGIYAINKISLFILGFYLPLSTFGSYGLLLQLSTILIGIATTLFLTYNPKFSNYRINKETEKIKRLFSFTSLVFFFFMIAGSFAIIEIVPFLLNLIQAKTILPSKTICLLYLIVITLEYNHSMFAELIATSNEIPFVKANLISGFIIIILTTCSLQFTQLGLIGVILSEGIVELSYNNWKWPSRIFKEFNFSIKEFFFLGFSVMIEKVKELSKKSLCKRKEK